MTDVKKWACSKGCDLSQKACSHLEDLLPKMNEHVSRVGAYMGDGPINNSTMDIFQSHFWSFDSSKFVELMRNYGFTDEWDIELLKAKYCRNLSAADVAKEQNYVSKDKVKRRLKQLRELLRERGFEQESLKWEPKK